MAFCFKPSFMSSFTASLLTYIYNDKLNKVQSDSLSTFVHDLSAVCDLFLPCLETCIQL